MQENKIEVMAVSQLLNMKFFVPSYQRGYRWTEQEVRDLLEDINAFGYKKKDEGEFYCLQPLVVRAMIEQEKQANELEVSDTWYEVIDGQQRLTTIYLILSTMKEAIELMNLPSNLYELRYQREANANGNFLKQITESDKEFCEKVDYYHASKALSTIKQWFEETKANKCKFLNTLLETTWDDGEPTKDQSNNVRFIWYESVDEDPIKVFTRLNIGKIGLTNAELIKALFLNTSNFCVNDKATLRLRQQEIAVEWDRIEYTLQKEDFWLFLNKVGYKNPTRIDFLFELMCELNMLGIEEAKLKRIGTDENRIFRYFYQYFSQKNADIDICWEKVKSLFNTFMEWYDDLQLFHYVGFLIACGAKRISNTVELWNKSEDKKDFLKELKAKIKEVIDLCPSLENQYSLDGKDKTRCKPILLFHNIQTVINRNTKEKESETEQPAAFYKFPFHLFKKESWDVEHINSNTENEEADTDTQNEWLLNVYWSIPKDVQDQISSYFDIDDEGEKKSKYAEIKKSIPEHEPWSQEEKNRIWNYTLLDSSTNRSYGNAIFSAKRRIIIGKDKGKLIPIPKLSRDKKFNIEEETDANSPFVPPCTRNVFLKYYSPAIGDNNYWTKETDAQGYLNDIKACIKQLEK